MVMWSLQVNAANQTNCRQLEVFRVQGPDCNIVAGNVSQPSPRRSETLRKDGPELADPQLKAQLLGDAYRAESVASSAGSQAPLLPSQQQADMQLPPDAVVIPIPHAVPKKSALRPSAAAQAAHAAQAATGDCCHRSGSQACLLCPGVPEAAKSNIAIQQEGQLLLLGRQAQGY